MSKSYTGYVYIWHDKKHNMFYIGSHYGRADDSYICSSKWMLAAYKKRPSDFKMRIIRYVNGDLKELQQTEQRWLDMIDDKELSISKNVMEGCNRYYNMKKNAVGGNGSANKGNSNIGGWNKGLTGQVHTDNTKAKMSESARKRWAMNPVRKKPLKNKVCPTCKTIYRTVANHCSKKCVPKKSWNKGLTGQQTHTDATKAKMKSRYRIYHNDGSWFWGHKETG